jgi:hypothetical protein
MNNDNKVDKLTIELQRLQVHNYLSRHNITDIDEFIKIADMFENVRNNSILGGNR